jgi:hypothetical protein
MMKQQQQELPTMMMCENDYYLCNCMANHWLVSSYGGYMHADFIPANQCEWICCSFCVNFCKTKVRGTEKQHYLVPCLPTKKYETTTTRTDLLHLL